MHELYELKDRLCEELEEYKDKNLDKTNLDVIDKLSHTIKNLGKIIEQKEEENGYSNMNGNYYDGRSYENRSYGRNSYESGRGRSYGGNSYARGLVVNGRAVLNVKSSNYCNSSPFNRF